MGRSFGLGQLAFVTTREEHLRCKSLDTSLLLDRTQPDAVSLLRTNLGRAASLLKEPFVGFVNRQENQVNRVVMRSIRWPPSLMGVVPSDVIVKTIAYAPLEGNF